MATRTKKAAKKKPALTPKEREERRVQRIIEAYGVHPWVSYEWLARCHYAELRAAVYAVVPGRQKARNIDDLLDKATTAVCRVIRRRG